MNRWKKGENVIFLIFLSFGWTTFKNVKIMKQSPVGYDNIVPTRVIAGIWEDCHNKVQLGENRAIRRSYK